MSDHLYCPDETRKALVKAQGLLNGIDYLEVLDNDAPAGSPRQQTLLVHCLLNLANLDRSNVLIEGGVRISPVGVVWAHRADAVPDGLLNDDEKNYLKPPPDGRLADPTRVLVVRTDSSGDFSIYTLRLILSSGEPDEPPDGFDRLLSSVDFTFKIDCPNDFDCASDLDCPEPVLTAPQIDYLAKDFASFRRLMLDRLSIIAPDWTERNPADLGIALVEVLAYAADQLSYYQDAVATEAYLGTARRRTSIRRHARMVDYFMHDGANARVWVAVEVGGSGVILPAGTRLLSRESDASAVVPLAKLAEVISTGPIVFETLHDLRLHDRRNAIPFYTWGDPECCLPRGATRATLLGSAADLDLREGDALIFQEVLGAESGRAEDADLSHRHVVRLGAPPIERTDLFNGETVLEVSWHAADALPFPLCLRQIDDGSGDIRQTSVALGNVVLADHGLTIEDVNPLLPELLPAEVPEDDRYRPRLRRADVTHAMPYDDALARTEPASASLRLNLRQAMPRVTLSGEFQTWNPQRDLLASDRFAPEFVVEMESDGRAYLRFGDDVLGRQPSPRAEFTATYRVGNGSPGNIGAEALGRVVTDISGVVSVTNPLPASGGTDPEPLEQVRLYAPDAFRSQLRAVTDLDWADVAQRHPEVQRAAATRRWTGSWHTWFVTVDRTGGRPVDTAFENDLRAFLGRFRLAGYDLEIDAPRFVPLDIALTVCVAPGYLISNVHSALLEVFGTRDLPDGRRGFFHPDNYTFGQPVYLSQIIAAAMSVQGVDWVRPVRFQRFGEESHGELDDGAINFARLEIARLDNDPSRAENGRIEFDMQGGL